MGCVATLEGYRHRGLMRKLINEYHKEVEAQGYNLSVIEGIPYFYRQFGYDYSVTLDEETRIRLEKLPHFEAELEIRSFIGEDIPQAMKLLSQSQSKFYVHSVRDEQIWKLQQETAVAGEYCFEAYAVEDDGIMVAYFRISRKPEEKELILREVAGTDYSASMAILSFLKKRARNLASTLSSPVQATAIP